ncbi:hypothetical protein [Cognatilysobacter terrigena]|uniref:hypothetical protein n=1 Tax=Cognatilysobacter terrigena TaxID=2488749 RepID=UPI00105F2467|nr:hypothetical protein [Lysobacter terrigena]
MTTAADIIDALNSRAGPQSRLRAAARVSWNAWLDRWAQKPGHVTGAPVDDVVAILASRELASPPPRAFALNRWQAFGTLWRQHWHPASKDERSWRWIAGGVDAVWHAVLIVMLLVITALRIMPPAPPEEDVAVQVEYIGRGTPAEEGGGPAPSPATSQADSSPSRAAASAPAAASAAAPPAPATPSTAANAPAEQTPTSPPATPPQPVDLSKPVPDEGTFKLPPTSLPNPTVQVEPAQVPEVRVVPIPELARAPELNVPTPRVDIEPVQAATPTIVTRDIPEAVRAPSITAAPTPAVEVPRAAAQSVDVQAREIPNRPAAASAAPSTSTSTAPATAAVSSSTGAQPSTAPGTASAANASASSTSNAPGSAAAGPTNASPSAGVGTGPKATPAPGSWATQKRGDDWGQSDRNRPGNSLYDSNGRPRLAEGPGSASAGHPPGMITQEIKDLDRAGTWLKRKPNPYEPTRWDRVWRPNQTLLNDWVDKGVKQVGIPIPGTNKRIVCIISILQFGGGCDISDPNLQEQPAVARPPPDVPFKPSLQENNGATWDKDGKAPPPPKLPGLFAPPKTGVPPGTTTNDGG